MGWEVSGKRYMGEGKEFHDGHNGLLLFTFFPFSNGWDVFLEDIFSFRLLLFLIFQAWRLCSTFLVFYITIIGRIIP